MRWLTQCLCDLKPTTLLILNRQPTLEDELVRLRPLEEADSEALYEVAQDPLIWEQHPSDRYQRAVEKLGGKRITDPKHAHLTKQCPNYGTYRINKDDWKS